LPKTALLVTTAKAYCCVYDNTRLYGHYEAMRSDLLATNVVDNMAESSAPVTSVWTTQIGYSWHGMAPGMQPSFGTIGVTEDYGKTINWQIKEGRDFQKIFLTPILSFLMKPL